MPDVSIIGSGSNSNIEAQVDKTFEALRTSIRPLEYKDATGFKGGHYSACLIGGSLPGALTAPNIVQSTRWVNDRSVFVLLRYHLFAVCTAFSTGISLDVALYKATQFTVNNSTGAGAVNVSNPSRIRTSDMKASAIADGEMRICGTAALSGGTQTLDAAPIGGGFLQIKAAQDVAQVELYRQLELVKHPVVLEENEGLICRLETLNLPASNTIKLMAIIDWVETSNF